ncbi:hypothetical protein DL95DRAFT_498607 [Leptodontidium sp. 2 PMI_412]|nr:hypothetical protein DL95DRAFT_498607 [Leptodontidium sp. 2 PMI_412]
MTLVSTPGKEGKELTLGGVIGGLQSYQAGTDSPLKLPLRSWQLQFGIGEIKSKKCWMLVSAKLLGDLRITTLYSISLNEPMMMMMMMMMIMISGWLFRAAGPM